MVKVGAKIGVGVSARVAVAVIVAAATGAEAKSPAISQPSAMRMIFRTTQL
jgi:hypothetical protein